MRTLRSTVRLLALVPLLLALLPAGADGSFVDERFVYETLPPTPEMDAEDLWRDGEPPNAGRLPCGGASVPIRLELPDGPVGRFLLNLRRNLAPWTGRGTSYALVLREGPDGPVVVRSTTDVGGPQLLDVTSWARRHAGTGSAELSATIECSGDGWTWWPDGDWGAWDVEAYNVGTRPHALGVESASFWYENGTRRLEDLKKYDLVVLGEAGPRQADGIADLRAAGVTVAGYVAATEEHRADGRPVVGDGRGPGGFDSRYVDVVSADGTKRPDGVPDSRRAYGARNYVTDPRSVSWQTSVLERIASQAGMGTDAVFLDTFGVPHPALEPGLRGLMERIRRAFPGLGIVVNTASAYTEVAGLVDGVLFESFTVSPRGPVPDGRLHQAALANALRRTPHGPAFDVIALDYVPAEDTATLAEARRRAEAHGFVPSAWRMVDVNPAIHPEAVRTPEGVRVTWDVHDADPHPEELARVDAYEVRRLASPGSAWEDGEVVGRTPVGARSVLDTDAPGDGDPVYAIRAFRAGWEEPLLGTVTAAPR